MCQIVNLPKSRNKNIVVQCLGKETLVYDLHANQAYKLNETSSIVYAACGEELSFDELKRKTGFNNEIIFLALDALKKENLIESEYVSPFAGMNRREVMRRVGLTSMIALPVIAGLAAPPAGHAQSLRPLGAACTQSSQCVNSSCGGSGVCCQPMLAFCRQTSDCCNAGLLGGTACSQNGQCLFATGNACSTDLDCASGSCLRNICA